jgi:hypothetical protein
LRTKRILDRRWTAGDYYLGWQPSCTLRQRQRKRQPILCHSTNS